jgi:hypothetical protein
LSNGIDTAGSINAVAVATAIGDGGAFVEIKVHDFQQIVVNSLGMH